MTADVPTILPPLGALEILAAGPEAFVFLDGDLRTRFLNPAAETLFGRTASTLYGQRPWEQWPAPIGVAAEPEYRRALADQACVRFGARQDDDGADIRLEVTVFPAAGGVAVFLRDVSAEFRSLEDARQSAAALWTEASELSTRTQELTRANASLTFARQNEEKARERMTQVMDNAGDMVSWYDAHWRWLFINAAGRMLLARLGRPADPSGEVLWDLLPQMAGTGFETSLRRAAADRRQAEFEELLADTGQWLAHRVIPLADGTILTFSRDVSDRHRQTEAVRHSEARYRALVEAATHLVWTADAEGLVADLPFWRSLTGQTEDQVRGRGWMDAIHRDDLPSADAAMRHALATSTSFEAQYRVRLRDGSYRWYRSRGGPVRNADGTLREWVALFNEVDRMVRRDEGHRFLVDAGATLTESLDEQATLATLAAMAVDHLADGAMITLVREGGRMEHVATRSRDGRTGDFAADTERMYPLSADAPSGYPRAIRTGEPELVSMDTFDQEMLPRLAADATHLARLRALDLYSAMVIPLVARGNTLGAMTLVLHGPERRRAFDSADLAIATELGRRAALSLDNARLLDAERRARTDAALAAERLQAVADAARAFAEAAMDPARVCEVVAEILARVMGDACVVRLLDPGDGTFAAVAARHRDASVEGALLARARSVRMAPTGALADQLAPVGAYLLLDRDTLRQQDASIASSYSDLIGERNVHSMLGVALRAEGLVVGTVYLWREGATHPYDAGDVALVQELASRAALLLERARLFARERSAREEAERAAELIRRIQEITASLARTVTINDVAATTLSHGLDALSAQAGVVYLLTAAGDALEMVRREGITDDLLRGYQRVPLDAHLHVADALRRNEIVAGTDAVGFGHALPAASADSWAAIPMHHGGRAIGALAIGFAGAHDFTLREYALLDALGRHCAQAIERARLLDSERDARDDAERANHAKSDLLAKVSHETRQPVHASIGWVDTIEMELHGPVTEPQREALRRVKQNQLRLLSVLNDLLDMSRIEAGKLELRMRDVPVTDVVDAVESAVAPQIRAKGIRFVFAHPPAGLTVHADVDQLIGIMTNLLSNAAKFTAADGEIELTCEGDGAMVRIAVRDTGIGIPADLTDRVFEPFFQVESGFTRTSVGTGLGLAISREAARAMGGEVSVRSVLGEGSLFTVSLVAGRTAN